MEEDVLVMKDVISRMIIIFLNADLEKIEEEETIGG
jgi:hypothetical protein